jgi:hypothetical protein
MLYFRNSWSYCFLSWNWNYAIFSSCRNPWMLGTTARDLTILGSSSGSPTPAPSAPGSGSSSPTWHVGALRAQGWFERCTTTPTLIGRLVVRHRRRRHTLILSGPSTFTWFRSPFVGWRVRWPWVQSCPSRNDQTCWATASVRQPFGEDLIWGADGKPLCSMTQEPVSSCTSNSLLICFLYTQLKNDDFLYLLADAAAEAVWTGQLFIVLLIKSIFCGYWSKAGAILQFQYGHPDAVCTPLVNAKKNGKNLVVHVHLLLESYLYVSVISRTS